MAQILKGKEVADALNATIQADVAQLKAMGISPTLGILRVGEREDDIAYERGACKRCEVNGVEVKKCLLPADVSQDDLLAAIDDFNKDPSVHGVLMFRPLPSHLDEAAACDALLPEKDIDGITMGSSAGVYMGQDIGYPPCTAQACMEILDHFGIETAGKKAVVIGRSLVIGRPAAMMLMGKNATVTICHTRTENMAEVCRDADIVIAAAGKAGVIGSDFFREGQTVIDVGIHVKEDGSMYGDVDFAAAEPVVGSITPVPGGVGTVTTGVLVRHVVDAAKKGKNRE